MKRQSALYEYLDASGVLASGSPDDIARIKKQYWSIKRKEWKRKRLREQKSYAIFLTPAEVNKIKPFIQDDKSGIAGYIKRAVLRSIKDEAELNAKIVGQIRAAFYQYYNNADELLHDHKIAENVTEAILQVLGQLQNEVMSLIHEPSKNKTE